MPRILILNWRDTRHPRAGGAEEYLWQLATRWQRSGSTVAWLTSRPRGLSSHETIDGIEVHRIGGRATMYLLVGLYFIMRLRDKFDIIVDSENGIPQFSPLFSRLPKIVVTYHVHRSVFKAHMPPVVADIFIWLELTVVPWLYRHSRFITISSTTQREMLAHNKSSLPIKVIEPGVDARFKAGAKAKLPTILYLGRLQRYKRIDNLIKLVSVIRRFVPDLLFDIAGRGDDLDRLRQLVSDLHLEDCVRFHGFVDDDRKLELLQSAWLFANASEMEGWGIGVIEAAACETPSIAYDVPGLRDAIVDGETGFLASDFDDLTTKCRLLLEDITLRERMGRAAGIRAAAFSWDHRAYEFLACIESCIESRRGPKFVGDSA